jgi:hypothetical protein
MIYHLTKVTEILLWEFGVNILYLVFPLGQLLLRLTKFEPFLFHLNLSETVESLNLTNLKSSQI